MPLQATSGAASYDGFGGGAAAVPQYIEDVFSTYLYTGNGSTQTITNGIDLSTKGGLTWIKGRSGATDHALYDTARGATKDLVSNSTAAETTQATGLTAFSGTGFSLGALAKLNTSAATYVSWTFRKQPKFFDVQTWTGSGANRTISHLLGSVPACIMVKRTDTAANWAVYHRSLANTEYLVLNTTAAKATGATWWNSTTPTSSVFSLGTDATVNASGGTYVAYIFAHDAGGFGLAGTDNVISCGSYTGTGAAGNAINLGYEPQWVLIKNSTAGSYPNWFIFDNMRGMTVGAGDPYLYANSSQQEFGGSAQYLDPTATGFNMMASNVINESGQTYIYIAIRRGPMKVPTTGTSVLGLNARTGTGTNATVTGSAGVSDAVLVKNRGSAVASLFASRLTGTGYLVTSDTAAEVAAGVTILQANPWDVMDGVNVGTTSTITNASSNTFINYLFRRAPSFMDVVCFTGTGSSQNVAHNLAAVPELMIVKRRNSVTYGEWFVYTATLGNAKYQLLNTTQASTTANSGIWNLSTPTSTIMSVGSDLSFSASPYVAYLFATCAGVSKVFSYTGNGSSQTINCGFTAGSRFVMIKRTDSTGDWYVWDSARGIVAGNDPHLSLNDTSAEVTTDDSVDTDNTGFIVNQVAATNVNVTSATYIGIAIA